MNNTDFVKIGFLVENLPSSRPLAREETGWSIYKPDTVTSKITLPGLNKITLLESGH